MSRELIFKNAEIRSRDFSGERNGWGHTFCMYIPDLDIAAELKEAGWNIKYTTPKDPAEEPRAFIPIQASWKFADMAPKIVLKSPSGERIDIDEESVKDLDDYELTHITVAIIPGKRQADGHVKAWLSQFWAEIEQTEIESEYFQTLDNSEEDMPF